MRSLRPIAVLPTIFRFLSTSLQPLAGPALKSHRGPQYGDVLGREAHEVFIILCRLVEQATEWQKPIFVMHCCVASAF